MMNAVHDIAATPQDSPKMTGMFHNGQGRLVWPNQTVKFVIFAIILICCFWKPLRILWQDASHSFFYSYITVIPYFMLGMIFLDRENYPRATTNCFVGMMIFVTLATGLLLLSWSGRKNAFLSAQITNEVLLTMAFILFLVGGAFLFFGNAFMKKAVFSTTLLVFLIPPPPILLDPILDFMRITSAEVAQFLLWLSGTPVVRHDIILSLSTTDLEVTPACSGFHAGVIMLILILAAGHMLLQSGWSRVLLAVITIPMAIVRNGFRIYVLAELCAHYGAKEIDSPLHSKGGPLFFALFMIPLVILLLLFKRKEAWHESPTVANK